MKRSSFLKRGFTLIELLLVIGIIAILASIVIVAVNPSKQLGDARNAQRRADVNAILNAVYQYTIDNSGSLPKNGTTAIDTTQREICRDRSNYTTPGNTCNGQGVNLANLTGAYLVKIPWDPLFAARGAAGTGSWYLISKDTNNRVTVTSSGVEVNGAIKGFRAASGTILISVTR